MLKRRRATILAGFLVTALIAACGPQPLALRTTAKAAPSSTAKSSPNIVFILTDDMSLNLMKYLPAVRTMKKQGTSFTNYFVTNSLCCPSRATIFTGKYPHNTGIRTNSRSSGGGYQVFKRKKLDQDTFATDLQDAGYRTAVMGKYMNEYQPGTTENPTTSNPAGWDEWSLAASGYSGFNYNLNQNGTVRHYGGKAKDYLTDVISRRGRNFISRSAARDQPFLLELAVFTPHKPYVPAPRHQNLFKGLRVPRVKSYGKINRNVAAWASKKLTTGQKKKMDRQYRKRAQTLQSINDLIVDVRAQLVRSGVAGNTYLVFTSDNGYHMGEHSLISGKMTAFNTDIHVPLVVVGPDVPAGRKVTSMASNIDLRATFGDIANAGTPADVDGISLATAWRGKQDTRRYVLVEHTGPAYDKNDPDGGIFRSPNPPDYSALRSKKWLYVEYDNGAREYYNRVKDPSESKNIAGKLSEKRLRTLHRLLTKAKNCDGQKECTKAAR